MGLKILEVLPDGNVVVDTQGLFRVCIVPSGEIVEELLTAEEAEAFVETYNGCFKTTSRAEIIDELCTAKEAEYVVELWKELESGVRAFAVPYSRDTASNREQLTAAL